MSNAAQIIALAARRITLDAEWNEAQHKRDHGKFTSGGGAQVPLPRDVRGGGGKGQKYTPVPNRRGTLIDPEKHSK